ncbi:MAG: Rieske (2Fe-2S) protein, partial [Bryobacteraceae bacterium]
MPPGHTAFFRVRSTVVNVEGEVFAMQWLCPHRGYPLKGACIFGDLPDCSWHHFKYDVRTGENQLPAECVSVPHAPTSGPGASPPHVRRGSERTGCLRG